MPSGTLRRLVSPKLTDVSEPLTASIIPLIMEAGSMSETSAIMNKTARCNIPEGHRLHTCRCEDLKFYHMLVVCI